MADITIKICDMCDQHTEGTESFTLTHGSKSKQFDLCDAHALPLIQAWDAGRVAPRPTESKRKRSSSHPASRLQVTTLDEIEKSKSN